jgi:diguanylate cyclase (GGDEF)-like protein
MDQKKQQEAIDILHFEGYMIAKEQIMFPIDKFLLSLENTTSYKRKLCNDEIYTLFSRVFFAVTLWLLVFIIAVFMLRKKLLIPIESLTQAISSFKVGDKHEKPTIFYNDEVGLMTQKFHSMKTNLDEKFEALKQLALTDPLTQIKNRRAFFDISKEYLKLSSRNSHHLSLLMLDIDFFKKVNDTYGHVVGDEILKYLVNTVQDSLRETDILARYGGEEFVVLLPETKLNGAVIVAENIRSLIESTPYEDKDLSINITVSIGAKEFTNEESVSILIDNADKLLYIAKENGRNRIEY